CWGHPPRAGAASGLAVLRSYARRRPAPVAASLLAVRAPGGVHRVFAVSRAHRHDGSHVLAHADRWLRLGCASGDWHRVFEFWALGASYVHHRPARYFTDSLQCGLGSHRDTNRDPTLLLHRHDVRGAGGHAGADALYFRGIFHLHHRWSDRCDGGALTLRLSGT